MKKLIIAEKNSLAKSIVDGIKLIDDENPVFKKTDIGSYYESKSFVVCAARGHLFTLCDIDDYIGIKKWSLDILPFFPQEFKFKPIEDVESYINNIKTLLSRPDIDSVVHAGDSGREGEVLIRIILEQLKNNKPVYRLWLSSQVDEEVKEKLLNLFSDKEKDNLYREGLARMYSDWLEGINLTRYTTGSVGEFMRVGRVSTTILKIIYEREKQIEKFIPETYYKVEDDQEVFGTKISIKLKGEFRLKEFQNALEYCNKNNSEPVVVKDLRKERVIVKAPKLFSQFSLQNKVNELYGFSPAETLNLSQRLYERKFISYPRTESEFLCIAEQEKISNIVGRLKKSGKKVVMKYDSFLFDDSKVVEHSGITPTINFPKENDLTDKEQKIYDAILNRFMAVFCCEERIAKKTQAEIITATEKVVLNGNEIEEEGWGIYEKCDDFNLLLPELKIGDSFSPNFQLVRKQTAPKNHYSVTRLNNFLSNPLKGDDEIYLDSEDDYNNIIYGLKIGTVASLPGILEKLCNDDLIVLKEKYYFITAKGIKLIEILNELKITMDVNKTIDFNKWLFQVNRDEISIDEYLEIVKKDLELIINKERSSFIVPTIEKEQTSLCTEQETLGLCPRCKSRVYETKPGFKCSNSNCQFFLFKEDKFWVNKKVVFNSILAKKLLTMKKICVPKMYSQGKDKLYTGYVTLVDDGKKILYKLEF